MIRRIFVDLDDVLCTMAPHMLASVGCPVDSTDYSIWPEDCGFVIEEVANRLLNKKYSWAEFWDAVPLRAWATIPKTSYADWLLTLCARLVGERNVFIATSTINTPACVAGKMMWLQSELPDWMRSQYLLTPRKYLVANSESLLIDDYSKNTDLFEANGGHTILVPRPWNCLKGEDVETQLILGLDRFFDTPGLELVRSKWQANADTGQIDLKG